MPAMNIVAQELDLHGCKLAIIVHAIKPAASAAELFNTVLGHGGAETLVEHFGKLPVVPAFNVLF
jgi:hypothetical protein